MHIKRGFRFPFHIYLPTVKMPIQQTDSESECYYRWKQIIPLSLPLLSEPVKSTEALISHLLWPISFSILLSLHLSSPLIYPVLSFAFLLSLCQSALPRIRSKSSGVDCAFHRQSYTHTHSCDYTQSGLMTQLSLNDRLGWDKQTACFPAKLTCI